jgi:hypothetical protein
MKVEINTQFIQMILKTIPIKRHSIFVGAPSTDDTDNKDRRS